MISIVAEEPFREREMSTEVIEPGKLDIARVIQGTFAVLGRNFVTFFALTLLLSGLPVAAIGYVQATQIGSVAGGGSFNFSPAYLTSMGIGGLASVITACILQGALVFATVQDMNGQRPNIGECLATGLRSFLPLLGLSILFGIAIVFGFVFFLVPGFMMLCAWCVAVPALVADHSGVMGAFTRSSNLTRGNRWRIFGLLVVVWVIAVVISAVIGAVVGALSFGSTGLDPIAMMTSPVRIVGNALVSTLSGMVSSTGVAVLYVELRRVREGAGPQWLAEIFS